MKTRHFLPHFYGKILNMKIRNLSNRNFYPNKAKLKNLAQLQGYPRPKSEAIVEVPLIKTFEQQFNDIVSRIKEKPYDIASNGYQIGTFLEKEAGKINDNKILFIIKTMQDLVNSADRFNQRIRYVNMTNILYSSVIKIIPQDDIISEKVSPATFRKLIDESLSMYYKHPTKEGVDVRHVIGRLVSLRDLSATICQKFGYVPKNYEAVKWTTDKQLDYMEVLEKAYKNYDRVNAAFTTKSSASSFNTRDFCMHTIMKKNYERNLIKTMDMLKNDVAEMIINPRKNYEHIKSNLEMIHTYFDKVPANITLMVPAHCIMRITKNFEKRLYVELNKKG